MKSIWIQWSYDKDGIALALKPTRIFTNMRSAMEVVGKRCQGGHRHVTLLNGKAGPCAQYPFPLVDAFLRCVELEERALRDSEVNLCNVEELHEQEEVWENCEEYAGWYDELTGEPLDPRGVKEGRQHEMSKLWERDVYEWVLRESVRAKGGRILRTRWVQNRKGQGVKCRFVGMEFAKGEPEGRPICGDPTALGRQAIHFLSSQRSEKESYPDGIGRIKCFLVRGCTKRNVHRIA